ncbi:pseudouridine synthase deg1 [Coniosporium apollinis]|uniref:Pseudouridine synthase deg1 n=1 Tax=Coniosporium apollinis TaxID=61459 RepID=A0ABQ9NPL3_9PEZI|nr:pseudouridine synthase deg1 [Coniosporium apollinis]
MADQQQPSRTDYSSWSNSRLIARVTELEARLKASNERFSSSSASHACATPASVSPTPSNPPRSYKKPKKPKKPPTPFDPSRYSTHLIALKFAYLGGRYNGYEHHANNTTPLPTVEEELFRALRKTRLIFPRDRDGGFVVDGNGESSEGGEVNWEGCEYSKCGRTDRGVSAFGQVVGVRVRSNRPLRSKKEENVARPVAGVTNGESALSEAESDIEQSPDAAKEGEPDAAFDPINDELPYPSLLNRVLPPDIRVLAWCPSPPPNFSARFNCKERRYKYFFTNPAFLPTADDSAASGAQIREGYLDIDRMRTAAKLLEGLHDFRNLCKVDPTKQLTNFQRRIFHADIEDIGTPPPSFLAGAQTSALAPAPPSSSLAAHPKLFAFTLHGSAFLWHQVRHIVAILFLIGQGLEPVSLISELLDIETNPRKPKYEMAAAAPLVLWDCIFPEPFVDERGADTEGQEARSTESRSDALEWVYVGAGAGGVEAGRSKTEGKGALMEDLWEGWRRAKMDEVLAGSLLDVAAGQGRRRDEKRLGDGIEAHSRGRSTRVFDGGDTARLAGKYIPVMQKERMESVEVINAKYAAKKGLDQRALQARQVNEEDGDE